MLHSCVPEFVPDGVVVTDAVDERDGVEVMDELCVELRVPETLTVLLSDGVLLPLRVPVSVSDAVLLPVGDPEADTEELDELDSVGSCDCETVCVLVIEAVSVPLRVPLAEAVVV